MFWISIFLCVSLCATCMCADIPLARASLCLDFLQGLMRALSIWGSVGGRMTLFVSACSHKSVLTWCVFEVRRWNSDEWVCVVSCGKTWISPLWLWPNWVVKKPLWLFLDTGHCKGKEEEKALIVHEQVTVSFYFLCRLHGRTDAII